MIQKAIFQLFVIMKKLYRNASDFIDAIKDKKILKIKKLKQRFHKYILEL